MVERTVVERTVVERTVVERTVVETNSALVVIVVESIHPSEVLMAAKSKLIIRFSLAFQVSLMNCVIAQGTKWVLE